MSPIKRTRALRLSRHIFPVILLGILSETSQAQDLKPGESLFQVCVACHSTKAGEQGMGPSLAGIFGRQAASQPGFRYSSALKKTGVAWNEQSLNAYLADPQAFAPGNRMPYSGMPDATERTDLIAYLKTLK